MKYPQVRVAVWGSGWGWVGETSPGVEKMKIRSNVRDALEAKRQGLWSRRAGD